MLMNAQEFEAKGFDFKSPEVYNIRVSEISTFLVAHDLFKIGIFSIERKL